MPQDGQHTINALLRKRTEISGRIEQMQMDLKQAVADLDHVEATLVLFKPDIHLEPLGAAPIPQQHRAFKGEITRLCLGALRDAKKPLTTPEIADIVMQERGLNPDDKRFRKVMIGRVGACLKSWEKKGVLDSDWAKGSKCKQWQCVKR